MPELIDYIARITPLLKARDDNAWELGDITCEAITALSIEVRPGRKPNGQDGLTLSEFASQINQPTRRVSEWWKCAALFPPHLRTFGDLTWLHYNLARRHSQGHVDNALELLDTATRLHMGYNAFRRWLKGELWEGFLETEILPVKVQPYLQDYPRVWATFAAPKEDR